MSLLRTFFRFCLALLPVVVAGLLAVPPSAAMQPHADVSPAQQRQRVFLPLVIGGGGTTPGPSPTPAPTPPPQPPATGELPTAFTTPDAVLTPGPIAFPADFMTNVKDYGAKGDGVTDDTAAIQRALNDGRVDGSGNPLYTPPDQYNGRPKALFFPAGTYLVSNTLSWVGCCVALQGQGSGSTIIKLKANAAGFNDPTTPRAVIRSEEGNMSFRQNIWDIAIVVGSGNPGAIGLDYISNNSGALRNVLIRSEDGRGVAGLELMRKWPGPNMFKNVQIEGFDYGIRVQFIEYSQTYENLVLKNQNVAGIRNLGAVLAIRGLYSQNRVPAIINPDEHGLVTLLDARLEGGSSSVSAIETSSSRQVFLYMRNVAAAGYRSLLTDNGAVVPGNSVAEYYSSSKIYSLFATGQRAEMLKLPVRNTPTFHDQNLANWAAVTCTGYFPSCPVADELQRQLNSGKSTIYFPFGVRQVFDELSVTVPPGVRRIIGSAGVVNGGGRNGGGIRFVVTGDNPEPLIIEQFGYGVKVEQRGNRPLVLQYGIFEYISQPGAGDLFAEDAQLDGFTIQAGQRFWGRQINNEYRQGTKITNNGGTLWILGMKTEGRHTVIDTRNGGQSEYLGGLLYPAEVLMEPGEMAFRVSGGARVALLYANIVFGTRNYDIQVDETRDGQRRQLLTSQAPERTRMYISR